MIDIPRGKYIGKRVWGSFRATCYPYLAWFGRGMARVAKVAPRSRTLILFGAGASYGSDDPQHVPPMGDGLFDALRDFSPGLWGSIPPAQAALFRGDFERGMEALGNCHPEKLTLLQWA